MREDRGRKGLDRTEEGKRKKRDRIAEGLREDRGTQEGLRYVSEEGKREEGVGQRREREKAKRGQMEAWAAWQIHVTVYNIIL